MNSVDRLIESPVHMVFRICKLHKHHIIVKEEIGKEIKSNTSPNII